MPNLPLDESFVAQLQEYVADGRYADHSAVLRDGLRWINTRVSSANSDHVLQEARHEYDANANDEWPANRLDEAGSEAGEQAVRRVSIELDPDVIERIIAVLSSQSGQAEFEDESAVVSRALFLLEDRKKLLHLRNLVAEADEDFEQGRFIVWKPGTMQDLLELGRQRMRDGIPPSPDVI